MTRSSGSRGEISISIPTTDTLRCDRHIELDMMLEPGEYLLTRDGNFPLRRGEWSGWESQSHDGLELLGGSKPGDFSDNRFWYYFFDLHVAAHADAHL